MQLSDHLARQLESDFRQLSEPVHPKTIEKFDTVKAKITEIDDRPSDIPCELTSFSPLGLVATVSRELAQKIEIGRPIELSVRVGNQYLQTRVLVTANYSDNSGASGFVGRIVTNDKLTQQITDERRKSDRWICDDKYAPSAIASNPGRYNDYIYFSFRDLSATGARALTSLRNKFIVRGMILECLISLPMVSQLSMSLRINNVTVYSDKGKDYLSVGFEYVSPTAKQLESIAQYILQFGSGASPEELRAQGLIPKSVAKAITFSFAKTESEVKEVQELRHLAYSEVGKSDANTTDEFDAKAKIIVGKYQGRVVTSCRVFFPGPGDLLEQEQYITLPNSLSRREQVAEVMRVCTHPDFRRSDLLLSLFRHIAITCIQSERPIVVGCAEPALMKIYTNIGFTDLGIEYQNPSLGNHPHRVISVDARECVMGIGVNPLTWNVVWRDTAEYLLDHKYIPKNARTIIRTAAYKTLWPIGKLLQSRLNRPRKANKKIQPSRKHP